MDNQWKEIIREALASKDERILELTLRRIREELGADSNEYIFLYNVMGGSDVEILF